MAFKSFDETEKTASERGLSNLGLINNPFQNALISSYQAANLASQAPNPFMAALGGAAVGAQQLQANRQQQLEMANFEDVAPQMASQFPQLAKLRAKDAYPLVKELMLQQTKQAKPISEGTKAQLKQLRPELTEEQLMTIDEPTATKYVLENMKQVGAGQRAIIGLERAKELQKLSPQELEILSQQTGISPEFLSQVKRSSISLLGLTPKPMSSESAKNVATAESGIRQIDKLMEFYRTSPNARMVLSKIGGIGAEAAVVGDTEAQKILNASQEAADTITRLRTGAALNREEEIYYGNLLRNRWKTLGGQLDSLNNVKQFLESVYEDLQTGKRVMYQPDKDKKPSPTSKGGAFSDDAFDKFMNPSGK